jgi:hypothetical protein
MNQELRVTDYGLRAPFSWALVAMAASAVIALAISLQLGIFVLIFAAFTWWIWQQPRESLLFLIIIAPLLPLLKMTQTVGTATLLKDVILIVLFARLCALPLLHKRLPYRPNILIVPIIVLAAVVAWSALRADAMTLGIVRARELMLYVLAYFAALYLPTSKRWYRELFTWFLVTLAVVLVLGIFQWFIAPDSTVLRFDPARQVWIPRLSSTFVHPTVFGHYLILATAALAAVGLTYRRLWLHAGALALALPVFLTYSRAVWLGYALALVVVYGAVLVRIKNKESGIKQRTLRVTGYGLRAPYRWLALGLLTTLLVTLISFAPPIRTYLLASFDPTYGSNAERIEFVVRLVGSMSNTDAMWGRGLGDVVAQTFREVDLTSEAITSGAGQSVREAKDLTLVDNQYLKTFVEMGFAGLLVYAWIYIILLRTSWHHARSNDSATRALGLAGLSFFSAFILQAAFTDVWDIFPTNLAFWFMAGLISARVREE